MTNSSLSGLAVAPLASHHDRAGFSCGVPSLDNYVRRQAGQDMRRDLAMCYVLAQPGSAAIMGFYTLSAASVEPISLPPEVAKRLGHYRLLPAVLLDRLAVDSRFRGRGLGEILLLNALRRTLQTGIGVLAVVVDAIDERAAAFYERFEFRRLEDAPLRLYLPLNKIRDIFPSEV